ncbi:MAG: LysR family transcriptional regulator [Pirellulaceae bacterium]|jgi:LysR family transcriptional regulator, hydrogen peroxide-inducible genes activator|nr:LysR family transcriptional regulator [Pirellulaceae bacterium]
MDLTQLRYFMTVVECSNFTMAAKQCKVSQPALSQQIAKLEKEFGCSLFNRMGRQVTLTPIGQTLRDRASVILRTVEDTRRQMSDDGRFGVINLAVAPVVGCCLSGQIYRAATQEFAECDLNFSELPASEIVRRIKNGETDVAILPFCPCQDREVEFEPVFEEELKLVLNRKSRLADLRQIDLESLNGERVCLLNDFHEFSSTILDAFDAHQVRPKKTIFVDSFSMMNQLVSFNEAIGFWPAASVPEDSSVNHVYRSLNGGSLVRRLYLCWNRQRYMTQLLSNFLKALRGFSIAALNPLLPTQDANGAPDKGTRKMPSLRK